ncbi:MAG: CDP-diacylglycerol diphosphatase [Geminicoccaceae bacterium]
MTGRCGRARVGAAQGAERLIVHAMIRSLLAAALLVASGGAALATASVDCRIAGPGDACIVPVRTGGSGVVAACTRAGIDGQLWRITLVRQNGSTSDAASNLGSGSADACSGRASLPASSGDEFLALVTDERPRTGTFPKSVQLQVSGPVVSVNERREAEGADPLYLAAQACLKDPKKSGCVIVDAARKYVVLKDTSVYKPSGYLTVPTFPVTGIEDPQVVGSSFPNLFSFAWADARLHVAGLKKPPENTGLAVNSVAGRTLNQLHIHMSCVRKDVREALAAAYAAGKIASSWAARPFLALGPRNHRYNVMVTGSLTPTPFLQLQKIPAAKSSMGRQTVVVIGKAGSGWYILNDYTSGTDQAQGEELLDQRCSG